MAKILLPSHCPSSLPFSLPPTLFSFGKEEQWLALLASDKLWQFLGQDSVSTHVERGVWKPGVVTVWNGEVGGGRNGRAAAAADAKQGRPAAMVPAVNPARQVVEEHLSIEEVLVSLMARPGDSRGSLPTLAAPCGRRAQRRRLFDDNAGVRRGLWASVGHDGVDGVLCLDGDGLQWSGTVQGVVGGGVHGIGVVGGVEEEEGVEWGHVEVVRIGGGSILEEQVL